MKNIVEWFNHIIAGDFSRLVLIQQKVTAEKSYFEVIYVATLKIKFEVLSSCLEHNLFFRHLNEIR